MIEKFRKCRKCGIVKPINEFTKGGSAYRYSGGIMTRCKVCWKEYYDGWLKRNPDKQKQYWRKKRRKLKNEHFFEYRARGFNEKKRNKGAKVTAIELAHLWKFQRGYCPLSGRKLGRNAHLDHIIQISRGGLSDISNLRWVDPAANQGRAVLTDEEFIELCKDVIKRHTAR